MQNYKKCMNRQKLMVKFMRLDYRRNYRLLQLYPHYITEVHKQNREVFTVTIRTV
jgi:hypothetical protein